MVKPQQILLKESRGPHRTRLLPPWFKTLTNPPQPTLGPCTGAGWDLLLFKPPANTREPTPRSLPVNLGVS